MRLFVQRPDQRSETLVFRRAAWLTLLVLLVLMVVIPPADAAPSRAEANSSTYSEKVKMAGGVWIIESENLFSDLTIKVFHLPTYATGSDPEH